MASHLWRDLEAAFCANGLNVLLKHSCKTKGRIENFGAEDGLKHLLVRWWGRPLTS